MSDTFHYGNPHDIENIVHTFTVGRLTLQVLKIDVDLDGTLATHYEVRDKDTGWYITYGQPFSVLPDDKEVELMIREFNYRQPPGGFLQP